MEQVLFELGSPEEREAIALSLRDASEVAAALNADWAVIGGHALIAHGVPRDTPELDILLAADRLKPTAS